VQSAEDRLVLRTLLENLDNTEYKGPVIVASHEAADRWLAEAVTAAPSQQADFAQAFAACAPMLHWNKSYPDLSPTPELDRYWANYCFAMVAGPDEIGREAGPCPFRSEEMALFLLVQGADVVYGRHHHPAVEVYGIVSGTGSWLRGDEGYRPRPPGQIFVHHPNVVHATTTEAEPIISWAAWLSDLQTAPVMI
jgi:mannose-6-phosphate isomerase-like protein (cupin superfamily)